MLGDREEALGNLNQALKLSAGNDPDVLYEAALVHNQLGDVKSSLNFVVKAIDSGYSVNNIATAQALDNLHSNREFQGILRGAMSKTK